MEGNINLAKLETLIRGDRIPQDFSEEIFILGYKHGIMGDLLMTLMFQLKDVFDEPQFTIYVYKLLLLGYCMGQKTFEDVNEASMNQANNKPSVTQ